MIPVVETERLILRGYKEGDLEAAVEMRAHPDVYSSFGDKPDSREVCWGRVLKTLGHWELLGYGYWHVEDKASGKFAGEVGFGNFKRVMTPSLDDTLEAGWVIAAEHHGKGYATETVMAILDWAKMAHPGKSITCMISPDNAASIRVAEKCGFTERCAGVYGEDDEVLVFDHTPSSI